jgi:hypothetical protein
MGALLSSGMASRLVDAAQQANAVITTQEAHSLAENPNALIEPSARAALSKPVLHELQSALSSALKNVFLLGTVVAALSLLIVLRLPGRIAGHSGAAPKPPPRKACEAEACERLMIAEFATIDAEHEPVPVDDE